MIDRGWKYYPALKLLAPFAAGIVAARLAPMSVELLLALLGIALVLLAIGLVRGYVAGQRRCNATSLQDDVGGEESMRMYSALTAPMLCMLFLSGALLYVVRSVSVVDGLQGLQIERAELVGRVLAEPVRRPARLDVLVECDSLIVRNSVARVRARVLVRIYDSSFRLREIPSPGGHISAIGTVATPRGVRFPGDFDNAVYLRSQGIALTMSAFTSRSMQIIARDDLSWFERLVERVRRAARRFAERDVGGPEGDIVRALLVGEREYIDATTRDAFVRTGTVHVLAVSGLHVGVIALALFVVVSWIPGRWAQLAVYVAMLSFYAVVAGGSPSIVRAVVMACAFKLAQVVGRRVRPLNTLAFAALVIVAVRPEDLFDPGFQLSFSAVAGILLIVLPLDRMIREQWARRRWPRSLMRFVEAILLSLGAQLATFPASMYLFGSLSVIAPLVNIIVMPLMMASLGAAAAGTATAWAPTASAWFGATAYLATTLAVRVVEWGAMIPGASLTFQTVAWPGAALVAAVTAALAWSRTPRQVVIRSAAWALLAVGVFIADRRFDTLSARGGSDLYLLGARGSTAVAVVRGDTLVMYVVGQAANDSGVVRLTGEPLARRLGVGNIRMLKMDSLQAVLHDVDLRSISTNGNDIAMRSLPVMLSLTTQRPLAIVRLGGQLLLQIPMRGHLDEAIVLRYDNRWEIVEWR